jgi:hypothetical protein
VSVLPNLPSQLIRIALHDLRRVEHDARYTVDMGTWHSSEDGDGTCHVCLAGAVIAGILGHGPNEDVIPETVDRADALRLEALDALRCGDVTGAVYLVLAPDGEAYPEMDSPLDREVVDYDEDPEVFHAEMAAMATDLEGVGL